MQFALSCIYAHVLWEKTKPRSKIPQLQAITLRSTKTLRGRELTRVFRVTGGNTNHYTTTDLHDPICRVDSEKKTCFYPGQEAHKYSCVAATTHDQHTEQTQYVRFSKCITPLTEATKRVPQSIATTPSTSAQPLFVVASRPCPAPSDQHTLETLPPENTC